VRASSVKAGGVSTRSQQFIHYTLCPPHSRTVSLSRILAPPPSKLEQIPFHPFERWTHEVGPATPTVHAVLRDVACTFWGEAVKRMRDGSVEAKSSLVLLRHVVPRTRTWTCSAPCRVQLCLERQSHGRQVQQHPPTLRPLVHINTTLRILSPSRLDSRLHEQSISILSTYRHSNPPEERHSHVPRRSPIQFVRLPLSPFSRSSRSSSRAVITCG
jgi:hypothetical protein